MVLLVARSVQHVVLLAAVLLLSAPVVLALLVQALEHSGQERLDVAALGAAVQLRLVAVAHVVGVVSW